MPTSATALKSTYCAAAPSSAAPRPSRRSSRTPAARSRRSPRTPRPTASRSGLENRYHYHEFPGPGEMRELLDEYPPHVAGFWLDVGHAEVLDRLGLEAHTAGSTSSATAASARTSTMSTVSPITARPATAPPTGRIMRRNSRPTPRASSRSTSGCPKTRSRRRFRSSGNAAFCRPPEAPRWPEGGRKEKRRRVRRV